MANREENLKKINAELEQLSDEELDKVAGSENLSTVYYFAHRKKYGSANDNGNTNLQNSAPTNTNY